jgi:hypothetical protein
MRLHWDAVYKPALRSFMKYCDLGIEKAAYGQFRAHVVSLKSVPSRIAFL